MKRFFNRENSARISFALSLILILSLSFSEIALAFDPVAGTDPVTGTDFYVAYNQYVKNICSQAGYKFLCDPDKVIYQAFSTYSPLQTSIYVLADDLKPCVQNFFTFCKTQELFVMYQNEYHIIDLDMKADGGYNVIGGFDPYASRPKGSDAQLYRASVIQAIKYGFDNAGIYYSDSDIEKGLNDWVSPSDGSSYLEYYMGVGNSASDTAQNAVNWFKSKNWFTYAPDNTTICFVYGINNGSVSPNNISTQQGSYHLTQCPGTGRDADLYFTSYINEVPMIQYNSSVLSTAHSMGFNDIMGFETNCYQCLQPYFCFSELDYPHNPCIYVDVYDNLVVFCDFWISNGWLYYDVYEKGDSYSIYQEPRYVSQQRFYDYVGYNILENKYEIFSGTAVNSSDSYAFNGHLNLPNRSINSYRFTGYYDNKPYYPTFYCNYAIVSTSNGTYFLNNGVWITLPTLKPDGYGQNLLKYDHWNALYLGGDITVSQNGGGDTVNIWDIDLDHLIELNLAPVLKLLAKVNLDIDAILKLIAELNAKIQAQIDIGGGDYDALLQELIDLMEEYLSKIDQLSEEVEDVKNGLEKIIYYLKRMDNELNKLSNRMGTFLNRFNVFQLQQHEDFLAVIDAINHITVSVNNIVEPTPEQKEDLDRQVTELKAPFEWIFDFVDGTAGFMRSFEAHAAKYSSGNRIGQMSTISGNTASIPQSGSGSGGLVESDPDVGDPNGGTTGGNSVSHNEAAAPVFYVHFGNAESTINYGGDVAILDFSWYDRYKAGVDKVIVAFCWAFFFWRLFVTLPSMINGTTGSNGTENISKE